MFQKARIKLTVWYLLLIMLISISFSVVVYNALNFEFNRILRVEQLRRDGQLAPPSSRFFTFFRDDMMRRGAKIVPPDPEVIREAKGRLLTILGLVNVGIMGIFGIAGYFLAGRTLRPIKEMVDEQNRFITDASHELRTPLTSLKTSIEVNLRNKNLTLVEAKKLIKSNLEEAESLRALSDGLIRLTSYQQPNGKKIFEKISFKEIVEDALDKIKVMALENKIKINSKIEDIQVRGEKKSLVELLVILLDNAVKYSGQNSTVKISAKKIDEKVSIAVSDEGIGIDEKDLPHIFDRFYRAEKSRSKKEVSGYGLGLSIAKKIVEMHKGSIAVKSGQGKGSTFTVTL